MTHHDSANPSTDGTGDAVETLLSSDPEIRAIEVALLGRWLAESDAAAAQILRRAREGRTPRIVEGMQLAQSRMFAELARLLEESMEHKDGFGPFGKR